MAKHEGKLEAAAEASLDVREMLRTLREVGSSDAKGRQAAIACLLSASEGWRKAARQLGGAFADAARPAGLTDEKER